MAWHRKGQWPKLPGAMNRRLQLPFAHLNLRRNPFGEVPAEQRGELGVVEIDRFIERLAEPGFAVEFIGDSGRGKTTHMRALWDHFRPAPFLKVAEEPRDFSAPQASVLFIDEAQFLSRRQRRKLFELPASFVVGTHEPLTDTYRRVGLDFERVEVGRASVELVSEMIERRIEWARRDPGPVPAVSTAAAAALVDQHGDDLRAVEHHLYEVFQNLEDNGTVGVEDLRLSEG